MTGHEHKWICCRGCELRLRQSVPGRHGSTRRKKFSLYKIDEKKPERNSLVKLLHRVLHQVTYLQHLFVIPPNV